MGAILTHARADAKKILESGGFESSITFDAPAPGSEQAVINGTATKHRTQIDTEGQIVAGKNAQVTVSEKSLTDLSYPVRNADDEVALKKHTVTYTDSTGLSKSYKIDETFPDETLGIIVCILKDLE